MDISRADKQFIDNFLHTLGGGDYVHAATQAGDWPHVRELLAVHFPLLLHAVEHALFSLEALKHIADDAQDIIDNEED